ncbi:MAG: D-aminoacyl-tRNA deacylase [Candidatus Micrarchaeia archaeon]|jgi:D-aminoacyl-tRNA deacylase
MIGIFYSKYDPASLNMAEYLKEEHGFAEKRVGGRLCFSDGKICLYEADKPLLEMESADEYGLSLACFLSKHSSAVGIAAFTTHPTGNWTREARLGGKPYELSYAAPLEMLGILKNIKAKEVSGVELSYEATHHGPLLKTPSLFAEIGGNKETIENKDYAKVVGEAVYAALNGEGLEFSKIVIGIGNTHYPSKFSKLALERGFAFAHMMPKYAVEEEGKNLFMLEQAIKRSNKEVEAAIIDGKSLNSNTRRMVISKLDELGIEYEKV